MSVGFVLFGRLGAGLLRVSRMFADVAALAFAYFASFCLRFEFSEPMWGWRWSAASFATVAAVHMVCLSVAGCYRVPWRRFGPREAGRLAAAMVSAAAALVLLRALTPSHTLSYLRPPYSVALMCMFIGTACIVAARTVWRFYWADRLRDADFMERDERTFDNSAVARFLSGRVVAVTGAGGTIGSETVRQVAAAGAAKILMIERCENALYEIDREMRSSGSLCEFKAVMADAGDKEAMSGLFASERPSVVIHAAACKHVPLVEANPETGWRNNADATAALAEVSRDTGVERFVLISTDKAVNPVSVMGKTKQAAEKAVMEMNSEEGGASFCAVRFGNVFGSSGSVIPLFREQIEKGGPVTVTHPDMKRYFMTVQEAVNLVLHAASRSEKAIYTLDMGKPVGILDLAKHMISCAGYRPGKDIKIVFTGIRPGEKLFEEIDISEKSVFKTDMAKIYITK